jgi:tripartite-type tricarboxylate transporter receptor subunit TctC
MELLKSEAGAFAVHIPYRGFPPAVTDMLGGSIDAMFATIPAVLPQVRAGKLRGLAVTSLERSAAAPEIPSVGEWAIRSSSLSHGSARWIRAESEKWAKVIQASGATPD